jgi:site-specific recombinase XerD
LKDLNFDLRVMCARNRDGSEATRADRERMLSLSARELHELGFKGLRASNLAEKHVQALLGHWSDKGLSVGTVKNRLSALRWWAEKIGKPNVVARDNAALGVDQRVYVTNVSKAKVLSGEQVDRVSSAFVLVSLQLQAAFGLRREESLKIKPGWADQGNVLRLQSSWTKGGRARDVPITNEAQREVVDRAKALAGQGSLIPRELSYRAHLSVFKAQCERAGINGVHGLRHQYAQSRYEAETGWKCPAAGGPTRKQLTGEQRSVDARVRMEISLALGHSRLQIVAIYLGR